jgi:hypothetical protein
VQFVLLIVLLYCMYDTVDEFSQNKNSVSDAIQANNVTHAISCVLFPTIAILLVVGDITFPLPSYAPVICSTLFAIFLCATVATTLRMNRSLHRIFAVLATFWLTALTNLYFWHSSLPLAWRGTLSAITVAAFIGFLAGGVCYSPALGWAEWMLGALVLISIGVSLPDRRTGSK